MARSTLRDAVLATAELFGGAARETILCENFDKHLIELDAIRDVLGPEGGLLDLGGGVGVNLVALRELGHRGRLVLVDQLIEYDDSNRMGPGARARELLATRGIELREVDFWPTFDSGYPDNSFDVVTCIDVIEHLHGHPMQQLRELERILKPGGLCIIGAPNAVSLMKRVKILAGRHPYAPFDEWTSDAYYGHIREYTCAEYNALVEQAGFKPERTIRSLAIPRARARNRYHRRRHGLLSPITAALMLNVAVEAVFPALRHSIYVLARKVAKQQ